ncbi:UbiX family flavin prenyltransferase [Collinsella sp. AGMB00827]|uniref:Flavin prenyltransferase UbiX n=1 Tax=Collinsella ureilytica TaxID=2869515 RepID=A0ABS7MKZ8_9ACTN|nr:UbiX family flavin prenyltransferase [Collinsella urealyticum]MBY4797723.1 UbiX family flavin prenyltransferase [Collinsella urealyticum]
MEKRRIVVGVSGATGVCMARYLLTELASHECVETHLVVSAGARRTWELECCEPIDALLALADHVHSAENLAACISSGSFQTDGMIVLPCSMKTLAQIAHGIADNLLSRSADVCLKEGRRVVLAPREMPLGAVHLRNLKLAAELGCVIMPPMLTFYNGPVSVEDQIWHIVGKILRQFHIEPQRFHGWEGAE